MAGSKSVQFPFNLDASLAFRFEVRSGLKDAGGAMPDNNEDVATWEDMTGNIILAGTPGAFPSYSNTGYNGYGKLVFTNAQNEGMLKAGIATTDSFLTGTIFVVFKQVATGAVYVITNMVTDGEAITHGEEVGGARVIGNGVADLVLAAVAGTAIHIDVLKMQGDGTSEGRVDGTDGNTGDAGNGGVISALYLNRSAGDANQGDLEMVAYIGFTSVLTDAQIAEVEYYLDQQYDLTATIADPTPQPHSAAGSTARGTIHDG